MGNILIQAWIYNDSKGTRLVFVDKSLMVGAKEENWEETSVVISISDIKEWCEACQEIIEAEAIERAIRAEKALELACECIAETAEASPFSFPLWFWKKKCNIEYYLELASKKEQA